MTRKGANCGVEGEDYMRVRPMRKKKKVLACVSTLAKVDMIDDARNVRRKADMGERRHDR